MSQNSHSKKVGWAVTLYHSSFASPEWRKWKMLYNNQEMDPVLKRKSNKNIGLQAGHLARGFEKDHIDCVFNKAFNEQKIQECILRFKTKELNKEVYLLFYFLPPDKNHIILVYTPIQKQYVPSDFEKKAWHPIKGPEHYGLDKSYAIELEKEIEIAMKMIPKKNMD